MVVIITISAANVQRDVRRLRKALQAVRDHLRAQCADLLALETQINDRPRTAGEIDHSP